MYHDSMKVDGGPVDLGEASDFKGVSFNVTVLDDDAKLGTFAILTVQDRTYVPGAYHKTAGGWTKAVGDVGPQGAQGPAGAQGPQGEAGPQGAQGPAGADGQDGVDGQDGTQFTTGPGLELVEGVLRMKERNRAYDISGSCLGKPAASAVIALCVLPRAISWAADMVGCKAKSLVAATGITTFAIQKNGSQVGTMTFAAGATSGSFATTFNGEVVQFAVNDVLSVVAPSTADATLENIMFTLAGTLSDS